MPVYQPLQGYFLQSHRPASCCQQPIVRQLLNVVHQAIQLPLALYLLFAPQAETIQTFVAAYVAEHRLNHRHAMTVNRFALLAIDAVLHPVGIGRAAPELQGVGDLSSFAFAVGGPLSWAFAAVDGKQFVAQKALFMAHQQYLLEQLFNLIGVLADELSQGGEVRDGIAGQRLENDVGLAAPLDLAAGGDALRGNCKTLETSGFNS